MIALNNAAQVISGNLACGDLGQVDQGQHEHRTRARDQGQANMTAQHPRHRHKGRDHSQQLTGAQAIRLTPDTAGQNLARRHGGPLSLAPAHILVRLGQRIDYRSLIFG